MHPRVGERLRGLGGGAGRGRATPTCLKEAALLCESGAYRGLDAIITVFAPAARVRTARVLRRDAHRSAAESSRPSWASSSATRRSWRGPSTSCTTTTRSWCCPRCWPWTRPFGKQGVGAGPTLYFFAGSSRRRLHCP
ncbi:MAG: hypothetical protein WKG07_21510 [Hymenobacter sp.]